MLRKPTRDFLPPASLGHHSLRESTSMANCIGVVACRWILGFAQGCGCRWIGKGIWCRKCRLKNRRDWSDGHWCLNWSIAFHAYGIGITIFFICMAHGICTVGDINIYISWFFILTFFPWTKDCMTFLEAARCITPLGTFPSRFHLLIRSGKQSNWRGRPLWNYQILKSKSILDCTDGKDVWVFMALMYPHCMCLTLSTFNRTFFMARLVLLTLENPTCFFLRDWTCPLAALTFEKRSESS